MLATQDTTATAPLTAASRDERAQFIHRQEWFAPALVLACYTFFQGVVVLYVEYIRRYKDSNEVNCPSCDLGNHHTHPDWLLLFITAASFSLFGFALLNMRSRYRATQMDKSDGLGSFSPLSNKHFLVGTEVIAICLATSHVLTFVYNREASAFVTDWFGLRTTIFQWVEWAVTVPFMMILIISMEGKESYSTTDCIGAASLFFMISCGALLSCPTLCPSGVHAFCYILLAYGCYGVAFSLHKQNKKTSQCDVEALLKQPGFESKIKARAISKIVDMSEVYLITMSYFPIVCILGWCKVLSSSQVQVLYALGSLACKTTCCSVLNDNALQRDKAIVQESQQVLRLTISNVAHDLKTPLAGFSCGLYCIKEDAKLHQNCRTDSTGLETSEVNQIQADSIERICKSAEDLEELNNFMLMSINRCIDYVKASRGIDLVPKFDVCSIKEVLGMARICMSKVTCSTSNITFLPPSAQLSALIITDKQWFVENIFCLLSNAVKYSHEGSIEVAANLIDTTVAKERGAWFKCSDTVKTPQLSPKPSSSSCVLVEIVDSGIGLPKDCTKLFGAFQRLQTMAGGTGLGLFSLAKRLDALNGHYGAGPRPDGKQGSLFWFSFPYRPIEMRERENEEEEESDAEEPLEKDTDTVQADNETTQNIDVNTTSVVSSNLSSLSDVANSTKVKYPSLNILLVEDSYTIQKMTKLILEREGHTVITAVNGAAALTFMKEEMIKSCGKPPFDVVLCDICMPVMDGFEFIKRLRAHEKEQGANEKKIPALVLPLASSTTPPPAASPRLPCASINIDLLRSSNTQLVYGLSANDHSTDDAVSAGMDGFLAKPFKLTCFYSLLKQQFSQE